MTVGGLLKIVDALVRDIEQAQGDRKAQLEAELEDFLHWDVCVCKREAGDEQKCRKVSD